MSGRAGASALVARPYAGETDLAAVVDLLLTCRTTEYADHYPPLAELRALAPVVAATSDASLWIGSDGRLVGFAYLEPPRGVLFFFILPDKTVAVPVVPGASTGLLATIVRWAVGRYRAGWLDQGPAAGPLLTAVHERDAGRIALLKDEEFTQHSFRTLRLACPLDCPLSALQLPAGYTLRQVAGAAEAERCIALQRAAFDSPNPSVPHRLALMRDPAYLPDLDLVLVAPDGDFAAFC